MPLASPDAAPQHGPRPLPLFLSILWRETEGDPEFRARALSGLRQFQAAARPQHEIAGRPIAGQGRARLIRYNSDSAPATGRHPVLFVPSLINPPNILDLSPNNSLIGFLRDTGHDVHKIDWGTPSTADRAVDIGGHVENLLLPIVAELAAPPILVGYCLGGTLAIAAAALGRVAAVATIAAPWDFGAYPETFRTQSQASWNSVSSVCERLGVMPMEVLQSGFWSLDPKRTIRKFADFGTLPDNDARRAAFVALEDWANAGAPLTFAAGQELLLDFYGANRTGQGAWQVAGQTIDPAVLPCPSLTIASTTDRLVPHGASPYADARLSLDLGHVGMIVSRSAPERLWRPLSEWLSAHGG